MVFSVFFAEGICNNDFVSNKEKIDIPYDIAPLLCPKLKNSIIKMFRIMEDEVPFLFLLEGLYHGKP